MNRHPLDERPRVSVGILIAMANGILISAAGWWLAFVRFPPTGWAHDAAFVADWPSLSTWLVAQTSTTSLVNVSDVISQIWTELDQTFDLAQALLVRLTIIMPVVLVGTIATGSIIISRTTPTDRVRHITGRRLRRGAKAAKRAIAQSGVGESRGLRLLSDLAIPRTLEAQGIALIGSPGSGKTTIVQQLIGGAIERGDRVLLLDVKGDLTATVPVADPVLLAAHDARSRAIDIAADLPDEGAAAEFAARVVPDSKDPMWSSAARIIFTGIVVSLNEDHGQKWGWKELYERSLSLPIDLKNVLNKHYPPAAAQIDIDPDTGLGSRTTMGVLLTMWASVIGVIRPLMLAWGDVPPARRFSMRQWILNDDAKERVVVLQRSGMLPRLSAATLGALLDIAAGAVASAEMSLSSTRRLWIVLDEVSQIDKVERLPTLSDLGREKGVCVVLATQDPSQIRAVYGADVANAWINNLRLKVVCQLSAGPSADSISRELIGRRTVEWTREVRSVGSKDGERSVTTSDHVERLETDVFGSDRLERDLGPRREKGETVVRALLIGLGDVFMLDWPLIRWPVQRAANVRAAWLRPKR